MATGGAKRIIMQLFANKSLTLASGLALFTFHAGLNKILRPSSTRAGSIGVAAVRGELTTPTIVGLKLRGVFTHCTSCGLSAEIFVCRSATRWLR